jgi:hypothetical protein
MRPYYVEGECNSKKVLNKVVSRGYLPVIKPRKRNPNDLGARIRVMVERSTIKG